MKLVKLKLFNKEQGDMKEKPYFPYSLSNCFAGSQAWREALIEFYLPLLIRLKGFASCSPTLATKTKTSRGRGTQTVLQSGSVSIASKVRRAAK
jgi:hypothetical protein